MLCCGYGFPQNRTQVIVTELFCYSYTTGADIWNCNQLDPVSLQHKEKGIMADENRRNKPLVPRCTCECGCTDLTITSKWETVNRRPVCNGCADVNHIPAFRTAEDGIEKQMQTLKDPYYITTPDETMRTPRLYYDRNHISWVVGRSWGDPVGESYIQRKIADFWKESGIIEKLDEMQTDIDRCILTALYEYIEQNPELYK